MQVFNMMVKILLTYAGMPLSRRGDCHQFAAGAGGGNLEKSIFS